MDSYATHFRNTWSMPRPYSLYEIGCRVVLDLRLDNVYCRTGYAEDRGIITISQLYAGIDVDVRNYRLDIDEIVYANDMMIVTDSSQEGVPLTLSNHYYNNYDVNGFNISVMICFQEYYPQMSGIILFKYGNFEIIRSKQKVYIRFDTIFVDETEMITLPDMEPYFSRYVLFVNVKYDGLTSSGKHHYSIQFIIKMIDLNIGGHSTSFKMTKLLIKEYEDGNFTNPDSRTTPIIIGQYFYYLANLRYLYETQFCQVKMFDGLLYQKQMDEHIDECVAQYSIWDAYPPIQEDPSVDIYT